MVPDKLYNLYKLPDDGSKTSQAPAPTYYIVKASDVKSVQCMN